MCKLLEEIDVDNIDKEKFLKLLFKLYPGLKFQMSDTEMTAFVLSYINSNKKYISYSTTQIDLDVLRGHYIHKEERLVCNDAKEILIISLIWFFITTLFLNNVYDLVQISKNILLYLQFDISFYYVLIPMQLLIALLVRFMVCKNYNHNFRTSLLG